MTDRKRQRPRKRIRRVIDADEDNPLHPESPFEIDDLSELAGGCDDKQTDK